MHAEHAFIQSILKDKIHVQHSQIALVHTKIGLRMLEMDVHMVI